MADESADWAVLALSALAHESRLQVHRLLVQAGEDGLSAGAIAEKLGMPASSLSFHLAHIQAAEIVPPGMSAEAAHRFADLIKPVDDHQPHPTEKHQLTGDIGGA